MDAADLAQLKNLLDEQRDQLRDEVRRELARKRPKAKARKRGGPPVALRQPRPEIEPTPAEREWAKRLLARHGYRVGG